MAKIVTEVTVVPDDVWWRIKGLIQKQIDALRDDHLGDSKYCDIARKTLELWEAANDWNELGFHTLSPKQSEIEGE